MIFLRRGDEGLIFVFKPHLTGAKTPERHHFSGSMVNDPHGGHARGDM
jgi:hypothetical protein